MLHALRTSLVLSMINTFLQSPVALIEAIVITIRRDAFITNSSQQGRRDNVALQHLHGRFIYIIALHTPHVVRHSYICYGQCWGKYF